MRGQQVKHFFRFYVFKPPDKFNHGIQLAEKCLNGAVLENFRKKRPILGTVLTLKLFYILDCLAKTLRLSTQLSIFWVIIFLAKKVAKLVETQNFCDPRLNYIFILVFYEY